MNTRSISRMSLAEHFSTEINRQSKMLMPPLSDGVIHYVTHVLIHFSESQRLFQPQDNRLLLPTLALLYEDAYNAPTRHQRNSILRRLGDSALFIGALFFEHFSRKGISKDYFIGMGGGAYSALGEVDYGDTAVFYELAERFPKLLQIVAKVCTINLDYNAEDIFSLLERWQSTKNATLRKQLYSIGIVPFDIDRRH